VAPPTDSSTAAPPSTRLSRGLSLSIAIGALVYLGFGAFAGFAELGERLGAFHPLRFLAAMALASVNYALRFVKWEVFLRQLGVRIALSHSLGIYLAGFALTVTPGKVGEVLKSYLLKRSEGVAIARTAPIVLAERVTDLVACLLLVVAGVFAFGSSPRVLTVITAGALLLTAIVLPVAWPALGRFLIDLLARLPGVRRFGPKLVELHDATQEVLAPRPFLIALALSLVAWAAECACFHVVVHGFTPVGPEPIVASLLLCTFIYAFTSVAGALSFLPGGLGVQEGAMVGLLIAAGGAIDRATASAATIVTRLATLWYAVVLGVIALMVVERRLARRGALAGAPLPDPVERG